MKNLILKSPEYYFLGLTILSGYTPPFFFNPFFIGFAILLILLIIFKNNILGLLLGVLIFLINIWFLLALLSEFNEFTQLNTTAIQLIFVGISIGLLNFLMSVCMIFKHAKSIEKRGIHQKV